MDSIIKNGLGVAIVSKGIECADRIVHETGIIKAVIVRAQASERVFSIYWLKWKDWPD